MDRGASEDVPVLIVGGSLVGLSAALFLRWHGVDVLAVERHAGTAINARAGHFDLRTGEILRSAGLEDAVRGKSQERQAMNSESGRRKKVHSWHTFTARTPSGRSCARST